MARPLYRVRQFWLALGARPSPAALDQARVILTPAQMALFIGMQPSEQAHSLDVLRRLQAQGETHPDLLVAALLHDVGKCSHPLKLWERVWVVLGKTLAPRRAAQWGAVRGLERSAVSWWRRPFIVAQQHPDWGAELALEAGVSPLAASLIRNHQRVLLPEAHEFEAHLLRKLQAVDDES